MDGVNLDMRMGDSVEKVPVLVAIGETTTGHRLVLGFRSRDKESAFSWRKFLKDLKRRGLEDTNVVLGVMDGLPGLQRVFHEGFPKAKVQPCKVHVARNVLAQMN